MFESRRRFEVRFLEEAVTFLDRIDDKAREKIIYNVKKAQISNDKELFKKLNDEIWEFRTLFNRTYYRLFAFWDKTGHTQTLVLVTHGLVKKTAKTPKGEIERAEKVRRTYFENG